MDIASDGAVLSTCNRLTALLKRRKVAHFLGRNVLEVFSALGKIDPALSPDMFKQGLPKTIDLAIQIPGSPLFSIRWLPTPRYAVEGAAGSGWQFTGIKVYTDPLPAASERPYSGPQEITVGASFRHRIRCDFQEISEKVVYNTLREKGFWEGEISYVSRDGKKSYLICSIRYVRDDQRRITGIMALNRDITEVKKAQQEVAGILAGITDGFFVLDQHFRVTLWNQEAERLTRISSAEIVGQPIREKMPELIDVDTWQSFQKAFKKKMTVTFEQYNEHTDRWLEMSLYPSGHGVFAYFKEVTLRKKQEALLALEKKVLELNTGKRMTLRALLNYFLKGLQKIFPDMYCCVLTLDEDGGRVRLLSAPGLPAVYSHAIDGLPIGPNAGSCGTAMFRKETVICADIATDPLWESHRDLTLSFGLRACWSIPVVNDRDEVLAAFSVYYTTPKSPAEGEMDTFERIANLVTLIIESKRAEEKLLSRELDKQKLIAQAMVDAQERERAEIGKELHDNINQILSTTKLYLELAKNDNDQRLNLINRSAANIHHAIREIRNISRSLVPSSIGDLGLQDSIADFVESIRTTRAIHVEFYPVGDFEATLIEKTKLTLFRIIQEQVNNVLKHSGARNLIIELILAGAEKKIELSITDDGKGFNPEEVRKKGLGLSNITSRAELCGGKIDIRSAPGRGCKLRVQIPV